MASFVPSPLAPDDLFWVRELLNGVFEIEDITPGLNEGRALRVRGRFLIDSGQAYARLAPKVKARGRTLLFRTQEGQPVIVIAQGVVQPTPNRRWLPLILSILTVFSVLFAYTFWWGAEGPGWAGFVGGLPRGLAFTATLLVILICHEFGHYFTARYFGVAVTLPFLIPFPLSPFGTMGAVISMKDIPPSRRAMLLIGAAGPLSGLVVGVPLLLLGLSLSEVEALPPLGGYTMEGNSILYGLLKLLVFGRWLPSGGYDVMVHPMAFAGWAGLMVTSLNLLPAGQLDGGHAATALLGRKARYVTWGVIALCVALGFLWQGWFVWALLIFVFSRVQAQPLDDVTPLSTGERLLALALLVLFVLTFTPLPLRIIPPI